ncbi:MAG: rhomboid family intramembrane serine protease, partial [Chloroflexi bacterium]|nr:rhomboid family intramembrane serine protease [Chloroflexota bacterium]
QVWRLITPILLHGSLIHIGFNMYALYVIGPGLERYYNSRRFLLLYLIGGFAGNVFSFLFSTSASLGASTAIFALIAAQGIFILKNRFLFGKNATSMLINVGVIVLINLALGLSPGIDNWGHMGGLVGGLIFAWFAGPIYKIQPQAGGYELRDQNPAARLWLTTAVELVLFAALASLRFLMQ